MSDTEDLVIGVISPSNNPLYPLWTPITSIPLLKAVLTTALTAAFIPGASPPLVKIAIFFITVPPHTPIGLLLRPYLYAKFNHSLIITVFIVQNLQEFINWFLTTFTTIFHILIIKKLFHYYYTLKRLNFIIKNSLFLTYLFFYIFVTFLIHFIIILYFYE